jgi:hypothetical protein
MSEKGRETGRPIINGLDATAEAKRWARIREQIDFANGLHPTINQDRVGRSEKGGSSFGLVSGHEVDEGFQGERPDINTRYHRERDYTSLEDRYLESQGLGGDSLQSVENMSEPNRNGEKLQGLSDADWKRIQGYHESGHSKVVKLVSRDGKEENRYLEEVLEQWLQLDDEVSAIPNKKSAGSDEEWKEREAKRSRRNELVREMDRGMGISRDEGDEIRDDFRMRKREEEFDEKHPKSSEVRNESASVNQPFVAEELENEESFDDRIDEYLYLAKLKSDDRLEGDNERMGELWNELREDYGDELEDEVRRHVKRPQEEKQEVESVIEGPNIGLLGDEFTGHDNEGPNIGLVKESENDNDDLGPNVGLVETSMPQNEEETSRDQSQPEIVEEVSSQSRNENLEMGRPNVFERIRGWFGRLRENLTRRNTEENRDTTERVMNRVSRNGVGVLERFREAWSGFWSPRRVDEGQLINALMSGVVNQGEFNEENQSNRDIILERLENHERSLNRLSAASAMADREILAAIDRIGANNETQRKLMEDMYLGNERLRNQMLEGIRVMDDKRLSEQRRRQDNDTE